MFKYDVYISLSYQDLYELGTDGKMRLLDYVKYLSKYVLNDTTHRIGRITFHDANN